MWLRAIFAWLARLEPSAAGGGSSAFLSPGPGPRFVRAVPLPPSDAKIPPPAGSTALLSVDDAGQFLLVGKERLTLGHVRASRADLVFLADVGALHAELVREDSLLAGPGWRIAPLAGERVLVEGEPVASQGRRLCAGERVRLATNLEFRYLLPDPGSASALLELAAGSEGSGARQLVLLAEGEGGRLRVGSAAERHVRVPNLDFELELVRRGETLLVSTSEPDSERPARVQRIPFPPPQRVDVSCGAPRGSRAPFGFSLEPVIRSFASGAAESGSAGEKYNPRER